MRHETIENFFFPLDNLPCLTVRIVCWYLVEKWRIDKKNREKTNHICVKLFDAMFKIPRHPMKALRSKDIPS